MQLICSLLKWGPLKNNQDGDISSENNGSDLSLFSFNVSYEQCSQKQLLIFSLFFFFFKLTGHWWIIGQLLKIKLNISYIENRNRVKCQFLLILFALIIKRLFLLHHSLNKNNCLLKTSTVLPALLFVFH